MLKKFSRKYKNQFEILMKLVKIQKTVKKNNYLKLKKLKIKKHGMKMGKLSHLKNQFNLKINNHKFLNKILMMMMKKMNLNSLKIILTNNLSLKKIIKK